MHWTAHQPEALEPIAAEIIAALGHRKKIALIGGMGAGKTTFTNAFCKVLGVKEDTSSPTFSIINQYQTADGQLMHHLDLYRLKSLQEALDIGIEDLLEDEGYCLIEWPQLVEAILPPDMAVLRIVANEDGSRDLALSFW